MREIIPAELKQLRPWLGGRFRVSGEKRVELNIHVSGSNLERLVVVGGDLEYLQGLPADRLLTHTEVRIVAGILRRLLIDDQLGAVWRITGAHNITKLVVKATDIDVALRTWNEAWVQYAWAGGASVAGAHHAGVILGAVPKEDHEGYGSHDEFFRANPINLEGESRIMTVADWLRSTSVAIRTNEIGLVRISRQAVLTYLANRKGGVHFDSRREIGSIKARQRRREIESFLLDHGLLRVGHLSGPEFEVQSMMQAIVAADWSQELVRVAHSVAPNDFSGDPKELKLWTGIKQVDGSGWSAWKFGAPAPEV